MKTDWLRFVVQIATKAARAYNSSRPVCLVAGGETTVNLVEGAGKGGRNQEMALSAGIQLQRGFGILKDRKRRAEVFLLCAGRQRTLRAGFWGWGLKQCFVVKYR